MLNTRFNREPPCGRAGRWGPIDTIERPMLFARRPLLFSVFRCDRRWNRLDRCSICGQNAVLPAWCADHCPPTVPRATKVPSGAAKEPYVSPPASPRGPDGLRSCSDPIVAIRHHGRDGPMYSMNEAHVLHTGYLPGYLMNSTCPSMNRTFPPPGTWLYVTTSVPTWSYMTATSDWA
jgi:hypothetical protein